MPNKTVTASNKIILKKKSEKFDPSLSSVVGIFAKIPDDARTTDSLGKRRQGSGVIINNNGLVLTIDYLVLEAEEVMIVDSEGEQIQAKVIAFDHISGFGLVQAKKKLKSPPIKLGNSGLLRVGDPVLVVSFRGRQPVVAAKVTSRRPFAGSWEYLQENVIFTVPPHHEFGGAALIDTNGELVGIGSLIVNDAVVGNRPVIGNMFVPIDEIKPILPELITKGRRSDPALPWLGIYTDEAEGRVYITQLAESGPGQKAGLKRGDIIMGVNGKRIDTMINFFRKIREKNIAGNEINLDVLPSGFDDLIIKKIAVKSMNRNDWLKLKQ